MSLTLQPMTPEQFASWNEKLIVSYAHDKVEAGAWPERGAVERSRHDIGADLPLGLDTPGHDLFVARSEGRDVGWLWLATDTTGPAPQAFIHDIEVVEGERGRGLGRALLEAAEAWCADHSIAVLKLHVFAHNEAAVGLYESSGFETTDLSMAKQIR
ncbi:GNAT family N-acetyltransferase [Aeromicrobium wangtongii]|uniref:GNAT family N-acetyltransferase n=1 Tax=Aeromicrobium wangtongii TaxID=2969247 RepID=A0ABY5M9S6_9ACTN|nr:GNAT family N-acetyltransferase [Aeromicrobium wangtongii]MCD9197391.1 GNAT family N-acetyltransferase [Aeromicrobium wangtongii]UUP14885.1 GNAT family N-acetyltransferase [Aeromicrobium wangtongii]